MVTVYLRGRAEEIRLHQAVRAEFKQLPETGDSTWLVCEDDAGSVVATFAPMSVAGYFLEDGSLDESGPAF